MTNKLKSELKVLFNKILEILKDPNSNYEGLCHLIIYVGVFDYNQIRLLRFIINNNSYPKDNAPATIPIGLIMTNKTSPYYWRKFKKEPRILFINTLLKLLDENPKLINIPQWAYENK